MEKTFEVDDELAALVMVGASVDGVRLLERFSGHPAHEPRSTTSDHQLGGERE